MPSGFAQLDAQLPGRGWPRRALTELLLPHPGVGEIRLLAGGLVATQKESRFVMFFDPPTDLSALALTALGLDVEQLLIINTCSRVIPGSDSLWALEQALKSGHVGVMLAWLPPRLRSERLRRLQRAAQRPMAAPLRLVLLAGGAGVLAVRELKRRGPPLEAAVKLELRPVLDKTARERAAAIIDSAGLHAATFVNLAASRASPRRAPVVGIAPHQPLRSLETFTATLANDPTQPALASIDAHHSAGANACVRALDVKPDHWPTLPPAFDTRLEPFARADTGEQLLHGAPWRCSRGWWRGFVGTAPLCAASRS